MVTECKNLQGDTFGVSWHKQSRKNRIGPISLSTSVWNHCVSVLKVRAGVHEKMVKKVAG